MKCVLIPTCGIQLFSFAGEKQWPEGPGYELSKKGEGGTGGGWSGGHEKRMAKVRLSSGLEHHRHKHR